MVASSRVVDLYTDDAFISDSRQEEFPKIYYAGSEKGNKSLKEDSPSTEERSKHGHECILQMNMVFTAPDRTSMWILDSGAACHVVSDVSLFSSSFPVATPAGSAAAYQAHDGSAHTVAGVGTISCQNFRIPDVLCVPDLRTGLNRVSVQQLAERDYLVMFGSGQCSVIEQSSGKIVGKGQLHGDDGLYHLEFLKIPPDNADAKDTRAP